MKTFLTIVLCVVAMNAIAQPRVFVSAAHGDDLNACSVTSPCRSFARAITVVAASGEILALDSGGYGAVSVTKAVSIVSPLGVEGSITQAAIGFNAIDINTSGDVALRGLTMLGGGTGNAGVNVTQVGRLSVQSCNFSGFVEAGIEVFISTPAIVSIRDCNIDWNGGGSGVIANGPAALAIANSRMDGNGFAGVYSAEGTSTTIHNSSMSFCGYGALVYAHGAGQTATAEIESCVMQGNGYGIYALGLGSETVRVSNSIIALNETGVFADDANAHISSRSNNTLQDNGTDGVFPEHYTGQ